MASSSFFFILFFAFSNAQNLHFANDNLIVDKPEFVSVSSPATITCEIANVAETLTACQFDTPASGTYDVSLVDGAVTNNGSQVAGVTGEDLGRPSSVCGIQIAAVANGDIGNLYTT